MHPNDLLADAVAETPKLRGMATTLIGSVIRGNQLYWVSVGDSPLWVFQNGTLRRINADHSMVPLLNDMVTAGTMTREEALSDYRMNLLRSGVAGKAIELVDLCEDPCLLDSGDMVVLASDGIETLTDDDLVSVLNNPHGESLDVLAGNLMTMIEAAGQSGQDNASVILYQY